ncbi:MAG: hypothetical protein AMJ53_09900 [Gammaproteobacteria bacterium SG8_11]|nr:MAG: hypothetical protein AMJ53_09900 [Gammaproteobacteria bacterium SG8_11]
MSDPISKFKIISSGIIAFRSCLVGLVIALLLAPACAADNQVTGSSNAQAFINALNGDNIEKMQSLADTPFFIRNQEWESAPDGYGFVLGGKTDQKLDDKKQLAEALKKLSETVEVEGEKPIAVKSPGGPSVQKELAGAEKPWDPLDKYIFLRGMGDVEHIVIVGINPKSKKVQALYIN